MNSSSRTLLLLSTLSIAAPFCARADEPPLVCEGVSAQVKSVALMGARAPTVNYEQTNGGFDPDPLLSATITVPGKATATSCLVAHFSTQATPIDNYMVFQVDVDGVPMNGHVTTNTFSPAVYAPRLESPMGESATYGPAQQMLGYTFSLPVTGGTHTVQVLFAQCCSTTEGNVAGGSVTAATLTLDYK